MQASRFNVHVPLPDRHEVFLMNTFSDAQAIVTPDVVELLDRTGRNSADAPVSDEERHTLEELAGLGFLVASRAEEDAALEGFFTDFREDASELRLTVLTTLQCNFACDYCIQGDHGDFNKHAAKMSLATAARMVSWLQERLDETSPRRMVLTFFGGEPLLNLPVVYFLAERAHAACASRGAELLINIITNGLLLTAEVVDRLRPFGLNGVKITLDGDRAMHDRMRPLRGGQGTFDRIVENLRRIAGRCRISIGGNFDADSVGTYPALLEFLRSQSFAPSISKVTFKPVITRRAPAGVIPLTVVDGSGKPLGGACMTSAGSGGTSPCDTCHFVDEHMTFLREETKRHGFQTIDGVHMGPCEIHKKHAYTIGPEGSLYACPGFSGEAGQAIGHIDDGADSPRRPATGEFESLAAWRRCGDCAYVPVCAGGCTVAAHHELGDMHAPTCHKSSFDAALVSLAHETASQV